MIMILMTMRVMIKVTMLIEKVIFIGKLLVIIQSANGYFLLVEGAGVDRAYSPT